ncbi:MAG: bifunctional serine/threonine-protein kinase/formylglycine-generating enzyme family protein [Planctomycetota bacterium]
MSDSQTFRAAVPATESDVFASPFPADDRYRPICGADGLPRVLIGGMGLVYQARDLTLDRDVAIKRMRPHLRGESGAVRRFLQEARAQSSLSHRHIVTVYSAAEDRYGPWLVLEWVHGESLQSLYCDEMGPRPGVEEATGWVLAIAEALHYAHEQGYVHCDVKPHNILLRTADRQPMLTDFGLVADRRHSDGPVGVSAADVVQGTFDYMAPEQRRESAVFDHRADQWALAKTFHWLLTGRTTTVRERDVPPHLRELILRALEDDPRNRFASLREFVVALRVASGERGGTATARVRSGEPSAGGGAEARPKWLRVPFDRQAARAAQRELSQSLQQAEDWTNSVGMTFRPIPAGVYGKVTITRPFRIGMHQLTQGHWQQVMGTVPWRGRPYVIEGPTVAACCLSWSDAVEFCRRLSGLEGRRYRLPTEAEWEWACRAGTATVYSFGDDERRLGEYAWWGGLRDDGNCRSMQHAHAVGQKAANPFGLYDVHGNVWEWCSDWYGNAGMSGPTEDPQGPFTGTFRVMRGGSWNFASVQLGSSYRFFRNPEESDSDTGCRVLLEL